MSLQAESTITSWKLRANNLIALEEFSPKYNQLRNYFLIIEEL